MDITKETTTLYASDRDVFPFLVEDLNPIEAGLLPDGSAFSAVISMRHAPSRAISVGGSRIVPGW